MDDEILKTPEWENYKRIRAPYTCLRCGSKIGLSFIEGKHDCNKPMFNKNGNHLKDPIVYEVI